MDFGHWDRLTGYYGDSLALSGMMAGGQTQWTGGLVEAVGAVQAFSGGFDWTSLVTPAPHSDNHYDPNGNHIVYEGTSNSFVLDLGLANDPSNGALAGQSVQYSAFRLGDLRARYDQLGREPDRNDRRDRLVGQRLRAIRVRGRGRHDHLAHRADRRLQLPEPHRELDALLPVLPGPLLGLRAVPGPLHGLDPYSASYQDAYATAAYGQDPLASSGLSSAHYQDSYAISMAYSDFSTGSLWS